MKTRLVRFLAALAALLFATLLWLPSVHWLFRSKTSEFHTEQGIPPKARELAARHLALWTDPEFKQHELGRMRRSNAEWDFMRRSFLVWSLAEMSLREPGTKGAYLSVMDQIIAETLRLEREESIHFFLMPYSKSRPFVEKPERSLFLDSEIALMLALRRVVEEKPEYRSLLAERDASMIERMRRSRALVAESYPDECWLFDHSVALAALKVTDYLDHTDHSALCAEWITKARQNLTHRETGLLVSSFTTDGTHLDGPEGSSIWMAVHCLRLVDENFARDQYERARKQLGRELCGFAWSRECPCRRARHQHAPPLHLRAHGRQRWCPRCRGPCPTPSTYRSKSNGAWPSR
jgi:hypothetical protein